MSNLKITNPETKRFLEHFLMCREINKEFYKKVPEEKLDFRMVNTQERKSDTPRESLVHQIDTTRDYVNGVKSGVLKFGIKYKDLSNPEKYSKKQLIDKLEDTEKELIMLLSDSEIANKKIIVPWSKEAVPVFTVLWGLDSHEILHTGWNLAIMDYLKIERFPALIKMWGK
jgi:hypothetical protein